MSDSRTRKAPSQDGLGLLLVGFGGLASVSIVLAMTGQEPREGLASLVTSPVVGLMGAFGGGPALTLTLALAALGSIAFLLPAPLAVGRHAGGLVLVAMVLGLLAGVLFSDGGGAIGAALPDLLGAVAGRIVAVLFAASVFLATIWGVWGVPMPRFSGLARETGAPLAASRYEDAAGVSTAESAALVGSAPAEPPPEAVPLRHEAAPATVPESPRAHDAVERRRADAPTSQQAGEPAREDVAAVEPAPVVALERGADDLDGGGDAGADPTGLALADDDASDPSAPAPPVWEVSDSLDDDEVDEDDTAETADASGAAELDDEEDATEYEDVAVGSDEDEEEYEDDDEYEEDDVAAEYEDDEEDEEDEEEEEEELDVAAEDGEAEEEDEEDEHEAAAEDEEYEDEDEDEDEEDEGLDVAAEDGEADEDELDEDEHEAAAEDEEYEDADTAAAEVEETEPAPGPEPAAGPARGAPKDWEQAGLFDDDAASDGEGARAGSEPEYVLEPVAGEAEEAVEAAANDAPALDFDDLVHEAGQLFLAEQRVAVSMLQKEFSLDFDRSCSVLDALQERGLIGPYMGGRTREILLSREEWEARTSTA